MFHTARIFKAGNPWSRAAACAVVLVAAVVAMTVEQHHAREKYEAQREKDCTAVAITLNDKTDCERDAREHKDYTPWWYVLVTWPEGVTTWTLIVTAAAITWQSVETRKAAQISERAVTLQFRPKVIVRHTNVEGIASTGGGFIDLEAVNVGASRAIVEEVRVKIHSQNGGDNPPVEHPTISTPFALQPGESRLIRVGVSGMMTGEISKSKDMQIKRASGGPMDVFLSGSVVYSDKFAFSRKTAFYRKFLQPPGYFVTINDPDREYAD